MAGPNPGRQQLKRKSLALPALKQTFNFLALISNWFKRAPPNRLFLPRVSDAIRIATREITKRS